MRQRPITSARWLHLAARSRIGPWALTVAADAGDGGCWETYEHPDGRRATVHADGRCDDPELRALLRSQLL